MHSILAALTLVLASVANAAAAAPADDLHQLMDDYWDWVLRENPVLATRVGVREYDDRLPDISLAAEDRRAAEAKTFLVRLRDIPATELEPTDAVSHRVLERMLGEQVEANDFPQRTMLFTTYSGWHQDFASLANRVPLRTARDFESYLTRLRQYPALNDTAIRISNLAVERGLTLPCAVLGNYERSISGVIGDEVTESRFYEPFTQPRPAAVGAAQFERFAAEARQIIASVLAPEYREHRQWYVSTYAPACRESVGISSTTRGAEYYAFQVRRQTTTDLTPQEIHEIGLREVARIGEQMAAVAAAAGFDERAAFVEHVRTDPRYFAETPEALLEAVALQAKRIDGLMPTLFATLPRLPYGIRAIPAEIAEGTTTAYYSSGSPESGIAGTYYVNTSLLDQRPLWEIPALSAHEAVPGHHHQIARQQELDLPEWRRHVADFTAFVEGWGLYAERLGIDMGIYDTPAKQMGRLSYEMWRACRLVVDTGIHALGWTKAQAIEYMRTNTALTDANVEAEVNRYISWPGQALAYKLGELKIRELRARAEQRLGERFDLRRFHDAVLDQGAVPLDVLERQVDEWISAASGGSGAARRR